MKTKTFFFTIIGLLIFSSLYSQQIHLDSFDLNINLNSKSELDTLYISDIMTGKPLAKIYKGSKTIAVEKEIEIALEEK